MGLERKVKDFISLWERRFSFFLQIFTFVLILFSRLNAQDSDHFLWTSLLEKNVDERGNVNYQGFIKDSQLLKNYLTSLENHPPQKSWSKEEIMAYWINAYNAYTVAIIIKHYPINGIKEIGGKIPFVNSTWDIKFITISGELLDLNNIEHSKLRKNFKDPRIHMALVCASKSCPKLMREAFIPSKLENQLVEVTKDFLSDPSKNVIATNKVSLSMIFKWYTNDFKKPGLISFINQYSDMKINERTKISYKNYDWDLNEEKNKK